MSKILIIRFSALGDVAMTIPVLYSLAKANPNDTITILTKINFKPLFENLNNNILVWGVDLKNQYKGIWGLEQLYQELKTEQFDYIADFHSVLRSKYICRRFDLSQVPTASIDKGRAEKKKLTRKNNKNFIPLKSTFIRYYEVLEKLGFKFELNFHSIFANNEPDFSYHISEIGEKKDTKWLGIAPFAKHKGKTYPLELQEKVIAHFATNEHVKIFVFGGGKIEKDFVDSWLLSYPSIISMVSKLNLRDELMLMSQLDVMLSMDSANMHLASLVATPVVSVWGATHFFSGFIGWNQKNENTVQIDLICRPCSIYGQKPCFRKDYACLYQITPENIIDKIEVQLFKLNESNHKS